MERVYPRVSTDNTKLGSAIANVNLPACITCRPDAPCYKGCYARKGRFTFNNVKNGIEKNYEAYLNNPSGFFNVIDSTLSMIPYKFFRWHSSGDIPCEDYLDRMCKLARKHKETRFLCFTKRFEIVNEYLNHHRKPENLVLVFSNWKDWRCDNPHNLPTAWVKFDDETYIPANANECSGFCGECAKTNGSCWALQKGNSVYFKKH